VIFYRNLVGDGRPSFMQAMLVAYQLDMYPGFPGHIKWLEKGVRTLPSCCHRIPEFRVLMYFLFVLSLQHYLAESWHRFWGTS